MSSIIVTATPPTPNGDLHVGHLSGPYLGADVYGRFERARGNDVVYISSSDDNQTYVETTASRHGVEPSELAGRFARKIAETLEMSDVAIDAFTRPDARHEELVRSFFRSLYERGELVRKRVAAYYSPRAGRYLFESFLEGYCPHCYALTAGAICEACGHPNDATTLLEPRSALDPDEPLERRSIEIVVLELERFRDRLEAFYRKKRHAWRPRPLRLVDELLERPLPAYPITYVSDRGVPAPFPACEGQVINVWAEMYPGLMRTAEHALGAGSTEPVRGEIVWRPESGNRLIQFLGYDNAFFFAVVHVALAMASGGRCMLPDVILTNEFYELENFKFSTSKNNVIWARDLLVQRGTDEMRFYLAMSNPEYQKTNFTLGELDKLVAVRLTGPWSRAVDALNRLHHSAGLGGPGPLEIPTAAREKLSRLTDTLARHYAIETFSVQRAAETLSQLLIWLGDRGERLNEGRAEGVDPGEAATLWGFLRALPSLTAPLLPRFARRLDRALGQDTVSRWAATLGQQTVETATLPIGLLPSPRYGLSWVRESRR